jgi:putative solute:sodium symporter small subunit
MADQSTRAANSAEADKGYWAANLRIIRVSLVIWALVSFGFGILLRPMLSGIAVGGSDLGFWFAQQGSILVFLALIFFYAWRMNSIDREHGVEE